MVQAALGHKVAKKPAAKKPAAKKPATKKPAAKKPVTKAPTSRRRKQYQLCWRSKLQQSRKQPLKPRKLTVTMIQVTKAILMIFEDAF